MHRYDIVEHIESGSQGNVVCCTDKSSKQQVAIKVFQANSTSAFAIESNVHKTMKGKSSRICHVVDSFESYGKGYIVMEKYKADLFDMAFSSENKMNEKQLKKTFRRICRGVRDLHVRGIAHLDIKPENVLVDDHENPFLCDFGCAFVLPTEKKSEKLSRKDRCKVFAYLTGRGTKVYSAPELSKCIPCNPFPADIFSLGVLLYTLLTGCFPTRLQNLEIDITPAKQKMDAVGYSLLSSMVSFLPFARPTIESVLHHSWMITIV